MDLKVSRSDTFQNQLNKYFWVPTADKTCHKAPQYGRADRQACIWISALLYICCVNLGKFLNLCEPVSLLWSGTVSLPHPHPLHMLKPSPPRWWYLEMGLWEVIGLDSYPSKKKHQTVRSLSAPWQDTRQVSTSQEEGPHQEPNLPWFWISQTLELWEN